MKKKSLALLLTAALVLSLGAVSASAGENKTLQTQAAPQVTVTLSEAAKDAVQESVIVPDAVGTVSFSNVSPRMRENNLTILMLQQSVEMLEDIDYEELEEELRNNLNTMTEMKWIAETSVPISGVGEGVMAVTGMGEQYDALKGAFDDIRDGTMQKENGEVIRQLQDGQNQLVLAGETTFIALKGLEVQEGALQRQLNALNRTVEEMDLRHELGQISELQLAQIKTGRTSLASGLETLRMNIAAYKTQLELLLGAELTGEVQLGKLPEVTDAQLAAMNLEQDLASAKAQSYELYDAAETLADAKEIYETDAEEYDEDEDDVNFRNARRTWQAAQYTYNDTVQNYELRFRMLYAQIGDYKQTLDTAKANLSFQQENLKAAELKCQLGTLSQNALLSAKDSVQEAEESVQTAANNLFSAYNNYCWAVRYGILN